MTHFRCNTCEAQGDILVAGDRPITCPNCGAADVAIFLDRSEGANVAPAIRGLLMARAVKSDRQH